MKRIFVFLAFIALFWGASAEASENVYIRIEGSSGKIFGANVTVDDCTIKDTDGVDHSYSGKAICALDAASRAGGFDYAFKNYSFGLFLKKISSDDTPDDYSKTWSLWANDNLANVGIDSLDINTNDNILLAFSGSPAAFLKVTLPEKATEDTSLTFLVQKRSGDYDSDYNWQGKWESAEGAVLEIDSENFVVPSGGEVTTTLSAGTKKIKATQSGVTQSDEYNLLVADTEEETSETTGSEVSSTPTPTPSATPTPKQNILSSKSINDKAKLALGYLKSHIGEDLSFITTDWETIALGAASESALDIPTLKNILMNPKLENATDVERHILAIRAAGGDPSKFNGQNYVIELRKYFSNKQIGNANLVNDDIFGVLAFLAAGVNVNDEVVDNVVATIITMQKKDGSWDGTVDMTAAGIQALRVYKEKGGTKNIGAAIQKAKKYLVGHQDKFGGFGENSATTAWGIQAIIALGEDPQKWEKNGSNPIIALLRFQNTNGSFGWKSKKDASLFMTSYAAVALLKIKLPVTRLAIREEKVVATSKTVVPKVEGVSVTAIPQAEPLTKAGEVKPITVNNQISPDPNLNKIFYFSCVSNLFILVLVLLVILRQNKVLKTIQNAPILCSQNNPS